MTKTRVTATQSATAAQLTRIDAIKADIRANGSGNKVTLRKGKGGFITVTETDATDGQKVAMDIYPNGDVSDTRVI